MLGGSGSGESVPILIAARPEALRHGSSDDGFQVQIYGRAGQDVLFLPCGVRLQAVGISSSSVVTRDEGLATRD